MDVLGRRRATLRLRDFLNEQRLYYVFFSLLYFSLPLSLFLSPFPTRHRKFLSSDERDDLSSSRAYLSRRFARIILSPSVELR